MLKKLFFVFFLLVYVQSYGQTYTIYSDASQESQNLTLRLLRDSAARPSTLVVSAADGQEYKYALDSTRVGASTFLALKNKEDKDQILSVLNCTETEFNEAFKPPYSGIITMLQDIEKNGESSIEVTVAPPEKTSRGGNIWPYIIGALIGLGLGFGGATLINRRPKSSTLKVDDTVWDQQNGQQWVLYLQELMNISQSDYENAGSFQNAVKQKYEALKENVDRLQKQAEGGTKSVDTDSKYFDNIEKIYIKSMQEYFAKNEFKSDMEPQKIILENLLPLAIHYESYIKIRAKKALDYDKLNYKNIEDGGGDLQNLEKVKFETNYVENSPFMASLIAIMKHYDIDRLREVNLYNQRIEK